MKISSDDVGFYRENGWYVSDYFVPDDLLQEALEACERIYSCDYDHVQSWSSSPAMVNFNVPYEDRSALRVDQFPSFHNDTIQRVVRLPAIAEIAAQLMGTKEVRYYKDILIGTPMADSRSSALGWHIDESYWPTCDRDQIITVYIPLQRRDESNGTLMMLAGSNNWRGGVLNMTAEYDELDGVRKRLEAKGREISVCPLIHEAGQVSFHSTSVVHGTCPNRVEELQYSVVVGLQAEANRFRPSPLKRLNKSLVVNLNDEVGPKLHDGTPDLKNDDFYPVLYRAEV